jgi:hypothetical protein
MSGLSEREVLERLNERLDNLAIPAERAWTEPRTARLKIHTTDVAIAAVLVIVIAGFAVPRLGVPLGGGSAAIVRALPALPAPPTGASVSCDTAGFMGTLAGDVNDPWYAWLVSGSGDRVDVKWPAGFTARFDPELQIVDPTGATIARTGETIQLGGGLAGGNTEFFAACMVNGKEYLGTP